MSLKFENQQTEFAYKETNYLDFLGQFNENNKEISDDVLLEVNPNIYNGKHILLVSNSFGEVETGVQVSMEVLARYYKLNGAEVTIVASANNDNIVTHPDFGTIIYKKGIKVPASNRYLGLVNTRNIIQKGLYTVDSCIIYNPLLLGAQFALACKSENIPTLGALYTSYSHYTASELNIVLPKEIIHKGTNLASGIFLKNLPVDSWITPSLSHSDFAKKTYGIESEVVRKPGKFTSCSETLNEPVNEFKKLIAPNGEIILLFVGKISEVKNLPFLARIQNMLIEQHIKHKLLIVGDNNNEEEKQRMLNMFDYDFTYYFGTQRGDALEILYRSADLFTFPSVSETYGFVTNESLNLGTPVIGANATGTNEIVTHGLNGYLLNENVHEWAKVIQILNTNRYLINYLKSNTIHTPSTSDWREYGRIVARKTNLIV